MNELKDRVELIIEAKKLTISKLEKELGLPNSFIWNFLRGEKKDLTSKILSLIIEKYNINPAWLLTGQGEMEQNENISIKAHNGHANIGNEIKDHEKEMLQKENEMLKDKVRILEEWNRDLRKKG